MTQKIYLLDGHSLAHRAFYALPLLNNSEGEYTNAVFGFSRMLFKLIDEENPDLLAVAFDKKAPTFRHEEYKEYKANRKKMPEELSPQIKLIKKMLAVLDIPTIGVDGYEADDVIGTLAKKGESKGMEVIIVTGDRDALQLVTDNIKVMYTKKGITNIDLYDLKKVREDYELEPQQLIDRKGLMGDSSDNIPGVPGIGPKTALQLLKDFSDLENVLANIDKVSGKKRKENLRKYSDQARLSKKLGEIYVEVPLDISFNKCILGFPDNDKVVKLFERLEFTSLIDRFREGNEIENDDIVVHYPESIKEIEKINDKVLKQGYFALELILDNYKMPASANLQKIIIALNKEEIYILPGEEKYINEIKNIIENKNIEKYMFHAKEIKITLKKFAIELEGKILQPLLASYLLNPSQSLPLPEELLKRELNLSCAEETSADKKRCYFLGNIFELMDKLLNKLKNKDLLNLYNNIESPLIKILADMEYTGINVDKEYLHELSNKWQKKLDIITHKVYNLAGEEFNLNSPKQLGVILFEKIGLPVIKKTKTGYSTGINVLERLKDKHEIIPLIMDYRHWSKLISTYTEALPPLINSKTGRIHTSFNQMVTATGRLSSTDPNLQNIPIRTEEGRQIRKAFIPTGEDWLLLAADYSQVELRVLAEISNDKELKSAFKEGLDIHTETASKIFAVSAEDVTANMRRHAKVINFGIAYGMSSYGLSRDLNISRDEAAEYIEKYFERFSAVKKYMEAVKKQAREKGYVKTMFNRRRYIPDIKSRNYHKRKYAERAAINTPIQGTAADIMKMAMIDLYKAINDSKLEARLLLQVHDEIVLEVKKDYLIQIAALVKDKMENTVNLNVPLIVDIQVGDNWCEKNNYEVKGNA